MALGKAEKCRFMAIFQYVTHYKTQLLEYLVLG